MLTATPVQNEMCIRDRACPADETENGHDEHEALVRRYVGGQDRTEGQEQVKAGYGDDDLGDPHHEVVYPPTEIAGDASVDQADGQTDHQADNANKQRTPAAVG